VRAAGARRWAPAAAGAPGTGHGADLQGLCPPRIEEAGPASACSPSSPRARPAWAAAVRSGGSSPCRRAHLPVHAAAAGRRLSAAVRVECGGASGLSPGA